MHYMCGHKHLYNISQADTVIYLAQPVKKVRNVVFYGYLNIILLCIFSFYCFIVFYNVSSFGKEVDPLITYSSMYEFSCIQN